MDSIVQCFIFLCLTTASFSTETANEDEDKISYHYVGYKQSTPLNLQCKMKIQSGFALKWYKDDKEIDVKDLENKDHFVESTNEEGENILLINHPTDKDIGNYTCKLQDTNNNSMDAHVNHFKVLSELSVRMEPSFTAVEGEELKLRCVVISKSPPYQIEWRVGNVTYETSRGRVELKADEKNIPNAIFTIKEAVLDDRGTYECVVFATPTSSSDTKDMKVIETYVRVKDKLAALWPFLGICAEVFVLCAIILIYEKKRNQAELEESDTDQSPDQKNTSEHGKDTVRQRK